jgi:hypothetical protein
MGSVLQVVFVLMIVGAVVAIAFWAGTQQQAPPPVVDEPDVIYVVDDWDGWVGPWWPRWYGGSSGGG